MDRQQQYQSPQRSQISQIIKCPNFSIQTIIGKQLMIIQIKIPNKQYQQQYDRYQARIRQTDLNINNNYNNSIDNVGKYFNNLQQIATWLQQHPYKINIKLDAKIMQLYTKTFNKNSNNTNNNNLLCTIPIKYMQTINQKVNQIRKNMQNIVEVCDSQELVTASTVKQIMKNIATAVNYLIQNSNNNKHNNNNSNNNYDSNNSNADIKINNRFNTLLKQQRSNIFNDHVSKIAQIQYKLQQNTQKIAQINRLLSSADLMKKLPFYQQITKIKREIRQIYYNIQEMSDKSMEKQAPLPQIKNMLVSNTKSHKNISNTSTKIRAQDWVDQYCNNYPKLSLYLDKITLRQRFSCANILGKYILNINSSQKCQNSSTFTIYYPTIDQDHAFIGIADHSYRNKRYIDQSLSNWLGYWSNGILHNNYDNTNSNNSNSNSNKQKYTEGNGFKQGQSVTVRLNFNMGVVQWVVNREIRCRVKSQLLIKQRECIKWVPYLWISGETCVCIQQSNI